MLEKRRVILDTDLIIKDAVLWYDKYIVTFERDPNPFATVKEVALGVYIPRQLLRIYNLDGEMLVSVNVCNIIAGNIGWVEDVITPSLVEVSNDNANRNLYRLSVFPTLSLDPYEYDDGTMYRHFHNHRYILVTINNKWYLHKVHTKEFISIFPNNVPNSTFYQIPFTNEDVPIVCTYYVDMYRRKLIVNTYMLEEMYTATVNMRWKTMLSDSMNASFVTYLNDTLYLFFASKNTLYLSMIHKDKSMNPIPIFTHDKHCVLTILNGNIIKDHLVVYLLVSGHSFHKVQLLVYKVPSLELETSEIIEVSEQPIFSQIKVLPASSKGPLSTDYDRLIVNSGSNIVDIWYTS